MGCRTRLQHGGILVGRYALVHRVVHQRLGSYLVKRLNINQTANQTLLMQFHHVAGDATQGEAGLDALVNHALTQILGHGKRSTARTGLQ